DLEGILRSANLSNLTDSSYPAGIDWSELGESEHFVQFYENDAFLIDSVTGFVTSALRDGSSSVVIATREHRHALRKKLTASGVGVAEAVAEGRLVLLDAEQTLSNFMVGGLPDRHLFNKVVGGVVSQ